MDYFLVNTFNFTLPVNTTGPEISCTDFKPRQFREIWTSREGKQSYTTDHVRIIWWKESTLKYCNNSIWKQTAKCRTLKTSFSLKCQRWRGKKIILENMSLKGLGRIRLAVITYMIQVTIGTMITSVYWLWASYTARHITHYFRHSLQHTGQVGSIVILTFVD